MAGLAPATLRLDQPTAEPAVVREPDADIVVEAAGNDNDDIPTVDPSGAILRITHGDGSLTVSLDGRPISRPRMDGPSEWFANLVSSIDLMELGRISNDVLRGVQDDIQSRQEWINAREVGINLLGLKIEVPGLQGASDGAPVEGMSKVRHPLLLEAVLRGQANARSELLPTDGPVKIRNDALSGADPNMDALANTLEKGFNHFLTAVATEYYPDTDRMLFMTFFGGTGFKKVYRCPLRMRPASESVDANDLIVNNAATDLANAKRITHRIMMRPSVVKRMQILGVYRDVSLSTPTSPTPDSVRQAKADQQGISLEAANPEDRDRELYECYCELDIKGYEHTWKGAPSGLELPWRVTIDVTSQEVLSIVRNWNECPPDQLPKTRKTFVKYPYVPGLGFYDIGLLHILGNTTNALTAAERELLDNGMFANFPGFLFADVGGRQNTNLFRVPPGGGAPIKTGGMPIGQAVMPLPYNTQQAPALMALLQAMEANGQRLGGTSELQVGEGRQDAPVGTTLALIEQASRIENSVHKRLHAAQAEEFQLLKILFKEDPSAFWEHGCASDDLSEATFAAALDKCALVPQADPNTASHSQRVLRVQALNMWAQANPGLSDPIKIGQVTIRAMGWSNPEDFMAPPSALGQPPPELTEMQAGIKVAQQTADARTQEANAKAAKSQAEVAKMKAEIAQGGLGAAQPPPPSPLEAATAKAKLLDAQTNHEDLGLRQQEMIAEAHTDAADRASKERLALMDMAKDILSRPQQAEQGAKEVKSVEKKAGATP